ncbi:ABC transporter ATP-binding protein [Sporomusa sp.]|uniref:ABC transporter ATP-binding protein n=1 Tax=Sporomusa sp. TaxID=2078658 RepID=UPI002C615A6F|nr:ABC transporter ATP-binding protein [Sporomusa sp.]HWR08389.1 ABC transporter ATP-binding protein [Sporomusa sp.]
MKLLELKGVTKAFGGIMACRDVSFATKQGQIMGLIGPNGAGKTTMFNLITGVYAPTSGSILFQGQELAGMGPDGVVARGIARTFQNIRLFRNLSVLDNVCIAVDKHADYSFAAALLRLPNILTREAEIRNKAMEYLTEVGLADKAMVQADSLPYGLQRKLEIARALALQPKLLLLDEPAAGMNPEESQDLAKLIRRIHQQHNLTILLIEHHMDVIMELCDTIFVLNFGIKLAEGTAQAIQSNPDVLRAYLGEGYKRVRG